jgi:hypothetical protein
MKTRLLQVSMFLVLVVALVLACLPWKTYSQSQNLQGLDGFSFRDVRFDESVKKNKPSPLIPKDWRLVSVIGRAVNQEVLWFEDKENNLYRVTGFSENLGDGDMFTMQSRINKISRK